jgi:hypothetical protein
MKRLALLFLLGATAAAAQDSSFSTIRVRASLLRLPVVGHIGDDWRAKTGAQVDLASDVGAGELALGVGHVGFEPTTGHPAFTETLISLAWTRSILEHRALGLQAGARLTDVRMDFDDPALVAGLQTEEEQLISSLVRGRLSLGHRFSGFAEATYGVFMTSTRTATATVAVGIQRDGTMPGWLRGFLR